MKKTERLKPDKESLKYIRAWCRSYPDWEAWLKEPSSYIPQRLALSLVPSLTSEKKSEEEMILMYKEKMEYNKWLLHDAVFQVMKNHTERYDAMVYIFQAVARGMGYNKELMRNHFSKNKMYEYMREVYNYLYLKLMVEEDDNENSGTVSQ